MTRSRRTFLKLMAASTGLIVSGMNVATTNAKDKNSDIEFKLFTLHSDNSLTIYNSRSEMGQGVTTSLTQLIMEELDADWSQIKEIKNTWADEERFGHQNTIGAISSLIGWGSHRQAGAAVKLLLMQTAAKVWQVDESVVTSAKGYIFNKNNHQSISYGQLTTLLQGKDLPENVELKSTENFNIIGKSMPRLDIPDKVTGKALFGIDQQLPNMKIATVARCPVFGGKLKSFDDTDAKQVNGVAAIFLVPSGVVVIANNYWQSKKASNLLQIQWQKGTFEKTSSDSLMELFAEQLNFEGKKETDIGDVMSHLNSDNNSVVNDFNFPLVAHMTMEPMNCTVWFRNRECEIWAPTQNPKDARAAAAQTLQIDKSKVRVNVTLLGGGFGRRSQDDFIVEACEIAKQVDYPVKVVWSREDDLQHDFYRPLNQQRISASLKNGKIHAWQHKVATLSTSPYHFSLQERNKDSGDWVAYGGAEKSLYKIPHFQTQTHLTKTPLTVGILRGISHGYTNFACEVTIDELAQKAQQEPIDFRLAHIDEPRAVKVLLLLKAKIKNISLSDSHYVGIAFGHEKDQGVYQYYNAVAAVIEKTTLGLKVIKVILVLDHGQIINPDGLKAQAEGSVLFALSMMFHQQIELKNGQIQQSNFHNSQVARMGDEIDIELHTTENDDWPMGVGEKLQGTIQPAIANALHLATGKYVRSIPVNLLSKGLNS